MSSFSRPRPTAPLLLTALAFALAACSPPSTATPVPTPTTDPQALTKAFRAFSEREDIGGTSVISGSMTIGPAEIPLQGTAKYQGHDSETSLTATAGGRTIVTRLVVIDGKRYQSTDGGPWLERGGNLATRKAQMAAIMDAIKELEYHGVVTGTAAAGLGVAVTDTLHHLAPRGEVDLPPDVLGLDDETTVGMSGLRTTLDFFVDDDARLVKMDMSLLWKQAVNDDLVDASMDYTILTEAYKKTTILLPNEIWKVRDSDALGYRIGVPPGWEFADEDSDEDSDRFENAVGDRIMVWRFELEGEPSLTDISQELAAGYANQLGVRAQDGGTIIVGGLPGSVLVFDLSDDTGSGFVVVGVTLAGPNGYVISRSAGEASDDDAKRVFGRVVSTFALLRKAGVEGTSGL